MSHIKTQVISLCHYRWAIPIIAEINRTDGSKFVTLVVRLNISRDALQRTLLGLNELALVIKNPGYGHPMRPEYILTDSGKRLGTICEELMLTLNTNELEQLILQKWSLPILLSILKGACHFSKIKNNLSSATSRAITLALKELCELNLVTRMLLDGFPPSSIYTLEKKGKKLAEMMVVIESCF